MFKKILVALDMSPMAEDVFAKAVSLAKNDQAELLLVHIITSEEDNSPLAIPLDVIEYYPASGNELTIQAWQKQWENYIQEGINFLEKHYQEAIATNVKTQYTQIQGSAARTICKFARENETDLIVIGRRGRTGLSEILLGSVSNYVLHHAHCSVLIVQKNSHAK